MTKRSVIGRRTLVAAAAPALAFPAIVRAQATGVALVVGNSKYQWEASLPNVKRDAPDVAKRFQALGLKTQLVQDAGRDAMLRAIDGLAATARGTRFSAFYFAGHGAAWGKETYLVPADADLSAPGSVDKLVPIPTVTTALDGAGSRLMVFDNCRNNPADGWRQKESENAAFIGDIMAARPALPNTLMLFSTAPGRIALDGPAGQNSPFAGALLRQIDTGSIDLKTLPEKMRRELLLATAGRQVLFDISTFSAPFPLTGTAAKGSAVVGGWAGDPSKIIELPNSFAFSDQHGLRMPRGLVAHRPPAGSPLAGKAGAYSFENTVRGGAKVPGAIVLLSVEEQDAAEVILMTQMPGRGGGWRFIRPAIKDNAIELQGGFGRLAFKWTDDNSGTVTLSPLDNKGVSSGGGGPAGGGVARVQVATSRFTRLD